MSLANSSATSRRSRPFALQRGSAQADPMPTLPAAGTDR